jgi:hypothetical protein
MTPRIQTGARAQGGTRRWRSVLAAVALAAASQSALAQTNAGGGSESIGSLPAMAPAGPGAASHAGNRTPLRVVFQGRHDDLRALVLEARLANPAAQPTWTALSVPGMEQVTFEGPMELTLDQRTLENSFVTVKVEFGAALLGGALNVSVGGRRSARAITSRQLDLHLQQLSWNGLLEQGLALQVLSPAKEPSRLTIEASGGKVRLVQLPAKPTPHSAH